MEARKNMNNNSTRTDDVNIKALIYTTLEVNRCKLEESNGIVTVTTPEGKTWDFTVPMEKVQSSTKKV